MSSIDADIILFNKINDDMRLPQITQEEARRLVSTAKYPITESSNSSKNSSGSDRSSLLDNLIKEYNDSVRKSGKSQVTIGRYQALLRTQNKERKAIGEVPLDRLVIPPPAEVRSLSVEEKTVTTRAAKPKSAPHKKSLTAKYSGHGKGNKAQRVNGLPRGWTVKLVARKGAGYSDKYWFSPDGKRFRSKISVIKLLGDLIEKNGNIEGYDPIMFGAAPSVTSPQKDGNIEQPKKKKKMYDSDEEHQLELNDNDEEYHPAESSVGENCKVSKPRKSPSQPITPPTQMSGSNVTSGINSPGLQVKAEGLPKGWTKKGAVRSRGKTKGAVDTYWLSPSGESFRSVKEVIQHMSTTKCKLGFDPDQIIPFPRKKK